MTTETITTTLGPGLHQDVDFVDYLKDPVDGGSLSHSGIKTLVKATPARFAWERANGRPPTEAFDVGHAAHAEVLGVGLDIAVIPENVLGANGAVSTNAAKKFIAEARADGQVPIKLEVAEQIQEMAAALRGHPLAGELLAPGSGTAEVSAIAVDPDSGVTLRSRFDWWRPDLPMIVDYKTAASAHPDEFTRAAYRFGYHIQDATYCHVAELLGFYGCGFRFVVQETSPPYLVSVFELDALAQRVGELDMRQGIRLYRQCTEAGVWPGYSDDVTLLPLPGWVEQSYELDLVGN